MTKQKNPFWAIVLALMFIGASFCTIIFFIPSIWSESLVLISLTVSMFLFCSWLTKSKKYSILITVLIFGLLLLNRFAALNIITAGLLAAILGLIALNT